MGSQVYPNVATQAELDALETTVNTKQAGLQYKDEGSDLGTSGTATVVDFVGAGVTASRVSNAVTVTVPSSGITNSAGANVVPKSNGTNLVASKITDDGTDVTVSPVAAGSFIIQQAGTPSDDALKVFKSDGTTLINRITKEGWMYIGDGSVSIGRQLSIQQQVGQNSAAIYSSGVSPTATNYSFSVNGTSTQINVPVSGNILLNVENTTIVTVTSDRVVATKFIQDIGTSRVTGDLTNATTTMANVTGLSATLVAGRTYTGRMVLFVSESTAVDGGKFDFGGGSATATDFRAHGTVFDTALLLSTQTTALATDFAIATITGSAMVEIYFTLTVNAAGTFIPMFAQNSHSAGTLTVFRGSYMNLIDTA